MKHPSANRFYEALSKLSPEQRFVLTKMARQIPRPLTPYEKEAFEEFLAFLRALAQQQEVQSTQGDGSAVTWHAVGHAEEDEPDYDVDLLLWAPTWKRIFAGYWRHSCEWIGRNSPENFDPLPDTNPTHWAYFPDPPGTTAHKILTQCKAEEVNRLEAQLATTRTALEEAQAEIKSLNMSCRAGLKEIDRLHNLESNIGAERIKSRLMGQEDRDGEVAELITGRDEARTALATAEALNREARFVLERLQWCAEDSESNQRCRCPACHGLRGMGHGMMCDIGGLLTKLPTPPETKEKP